MALLPLIKMITLGNDYVFLPYNGLIYHRVTASLSIVIKEDIVK